MEKSITLRALQLSDKSDLAKLANNKKIWDNLRDYIPYPYTEKDAEVFINLSKEQNPTQTFGIAYDGMLVGVIGFNVQKDIYRKSAEVGYWIGEPFWGKGIATEAVKLITAYGFNELELIRIYTGVFEHNTASMKVLEKNGYSREGIFKNAVIKNGKVCDEHRFFILKTQ